MTIEKREQVFISSTFKDLVEERRAVIQTLLEADCIPAGMELFPASNIEKFELIKRVIDLCDYYVVIVGGRYGSVDAEEHLSYTELEFDYAVKTKTPVMGFLHGDPGQLVGNKLDMDPELREKLNGFRAKVEQRMVKYWNQPGDLSGQVALAIMQIRKSDPVEGWIRGSEAMTAEVKAELVELRARVRELSADLKDEQRHHASALDPSDLEQGESTVELKCVITFHWQDTMDAEEARKNNRERSLATVEPTWDDVFSHLGPELMDESSEEHLRERLSALCLTLARRKYVREDPVDVEGEGQETSNGDAGQGRDVGWIYEAEVGIESFNDVKVQFAGLGLTEKGTKRRPGSDTNTYWMLSDRGHTELIRVRAVRKEQETAKAPPAD